MSIYREVLLKSIEQVDKHIAQYKDDLAYSEKKVAYWQGYAAALGDRSYLVDPEIASWKAECGVALEAVEMLRKSRLELFSELLSSIDVVEVPIEEQKRAIWDKIEV